MTAKKKRKKLINSAALLHPQSLSARLYPLEIVGDSLGHPRIVFDECSGIQVDWGGGSKSRDGELSRFVTELFGNRENSSKNEISHGIDVQAMRLTTAVGREHIVGWNVILWSGAGDAQRSLFVQVSSATFPEGSRESFVQLLEYAEEELECERVYMVFTADHQHREAIVKTFMFLGFVPVPSTHKGLPPCGNKTNDMGNSAEKLMFMGYIIE
jgi:hypothetical protein